MARRKFSWTNYRLNQSERINQVVDELREYWPLTLRQVYYRLVAANVISNTRSKYNDLSKVIKQMRLDGMLSWVAIEDRTRRITDKRGLSDESEFIEQEIDWFLDGYNRCLVQGQEKYVELWVEKDALSKIFEDVAYPYCIRAVICKGYQSVSFTKNYMDRAIKAMRQGQQPVILYFGDFDPSGVQMFEATQETLENEMGVRGVQYKRIALNFEDIERNNLPPDPEAIKETDKRYKWFVNKYGRYAFELDALHPAILKKLAVGAIEGELDMDLFHEQQEIEEMEREKIEAIKDDVFQFLSERNYV